jgi:hypothetical protein
MHNCFLCLQPLPPPSSAAASSATDDRPSQPLTSLPTAATASGEKHESCDLTPYFVLLTFFGSDLYWPLHCLVQRQQGVFVLLFMHAVFAMVGCRVGLCIRGPNLQCFAVDGAFQGDSFSASLLSEILKV